MLELKHVSKVYQTKTKNQVKALDDINLVLPNRGMVFILGKSGSGKSTLLNILGGIDKISTGDVIIKGTSCKNFKQQDFDSYRNTLVGFIFQEYNLLEEFNVAQNIGLSLRLQGKNVTSKKIHEILSEVDLVGYETRKTNELSGGQCQRVAIARTLIKNPEIILADEPTGALDYTTGKQILATLKKLSENRLVIVVSHDEEFAYTYGDRIIKLSDGKVIEDITRINRNEILNNDNNLIFEAGTIKVPSMYQLTLDDLEKINQYLSLVNEQTINIQSIGNSEKNFETTKLISQSEEKYQTIKSKLPFLESLKIGANGLKYKKIKLVLTIILSSIAFAFFGFVNTASNYNQVTTISKSIEDMNINYVNLSKQEITQYDWGESSKISKIAEKELIDLSNRYNINFTPVYSDFRGESLIYQNLETDKYVSYYSTSASGVIELSLEELEKNNFELIGNYPTNYDEILITKYIADIFIYHKYKLGNSDAIKIQTPTDMINKYLTFGDKNYKITGIVDTHFNEKRYELLKRENLNYNLKVFMKQIEFDAVISSSYHNMIIVKTGYHNEIVSNIEGLYPSNCYINTTNYNELLSSMRINQILKEEKLDYSNLILRDNFNNQLANNQFILSISKEMVLNYLINKYDVHQLVTEIIISDYEEILSRYNEIFNSIENETSKNIKALASLSMLVQDETITLETSEIILKKVMFKVLKHDYLTMNDDYYFSGLNQKLDSISKQFELVGFELNDSISSDVTLYFNDANYSVYEDLYQYGYYSIIGYLDSSKSSTVLELAKLNHKITDDKFYTYNNEITVIVNNINFILEGISVVFFTVGIIFSIFASLLLCNFIANSINYKKREIGILRAIGARSVDVFSIFLNESLIIALINFIIATSLTLLSVIVVNNLIQTQGGLQLTILNFGFSEIILIFIISFLVATIASFLPVYRISHKKPIDAIRKR